MFFDLCRDEGNAFVTKLPVNTNLLFPFTGRRGGRRKGQEKVNYLDFTDGAGVPAGKNERVWTRVLWDTNMPAQYLWALYSARFQLEFVFRDAKQYASLTTCQLRSKKGLEKHWNAALLTLSLARAEHLLRVTAWTGKPAEQIAFSMEDARRRAFNVLFAQRILANLGLEQRFEE